MNIPSSFNGVTFYVRGITTAGFNNQVVMHDIVNGKYGPYIEVLGQGAQIYDVDAFVSYNSGTYLDKDLLQAQIKSSKTGEFYHPEYGLLNCACLGISISEDARTVGVCNIRLQLVVVNNNYYNISGSDSGSLISLVEKAVNVVSDPVESLGLNSTCLGLLGTGLSSVTNAGNLGRYFEAGTGLLTVGAATSEVIANNSQIRSVLS